MSNRTTNYKRAKMRRAILQRRLFGLSAIICAIIVIVMATSGTSVEEKDITSALILIPMGTYLLFAKE